MCIPKTFGKRDRNNFFFLNLCKNKKNIVAFNLIYRNDIVYRKSRTPIEQTIWEGVYQTIKKNVKFERGKKREGERENEKKYVKLIW